MDTFSYAVTRNSKLSAKTRIIRADLGDGYSQRTPDGLNYISETWSIECIGTSSTIDTIESFLVGKGGYLAFSWTAPGDTSAKAWTCSEWTRSNVGGNVYSLTATFNREFDL